MITIIDTSSLPANLIIGNTSDKPISFNLYPDNSDFTLNPEEQIIYKVTTAREYLYYYVICKAVGLSLAEVENE